LTVALSDLDGEDPARIALIAASPGEGHSRTLLLGRFRVAAAR